MSNLRSKLIRLAHQKPELRPHLLPLLKTAASGRPRRFTKNDWMAFSGTPKFNDFSDPWIAEFQFTGDLDGDVEYGKYDVLAMAYQDGITMELHRADKKGVDEIILHKNITYLMDSEDYGELLEKTNRTLKSTGQLPIGFRFLSR